MNSITNCFLVLLFQWSDVATTFTPACREGLCRNNGTCMERPYSMGGFQCACAEDFHGRFCDNRLPQVQCLRDRILLTVGKPLIQEEIGSVDKRFVYLGRDRYNDPGCLSRDSGSNLTLTLRWPFTVCGTSLKKERGMLVFSNRLFLDTTAYTSSTTPPATLHKLILLDWSCVYPSKYMVSYPLGIKPAVNEPERQVVYGKFTIDMKVFQSDDLSPTSELRPPASLTIGQRIYSQVDLMTSQNDLTVTYKSCIASNVADPSKENTPYHHKLLDRGCPHGVDPTVLIHQSGSSTKATFSFQMFTWSRDDVPVYLHCLVSVCNVTMYQELCRPTCLQNVTSTSARLRRSVADEAHREPDIQLAIGPFSVGNNGASMKSQHLQNDLNTPTVRSIDKEETGSLIQPEYIVVAVIAVIAVICIFVICLAVFMRRRRHRERHYVVDKRVVQRRDPEIRTLSAGIRPHSPGGNRWDYPGTSFS